MVHYKTTRYRGLVISLLGAVLAALSPNFAILLAGRIVQAIGTGVLIPVMTSVLLIIFLFINVEL